MPDVFAYQVVDELDATLADERWEWLDGIAPEFVQVRDI
jgi:hypothetical protein